jgi:hypothetical protein
MADNPASIFGSKSMNRIEFLSKVGSDGMVHVNVPVGVASADQAVKVIVEPVQRTLTQEEWRDQVMATAGQWRGDFERPPQGEFEQREPLS